MYSVHWSADKNLTRGKGRVTNSSFGFTVLCRSKADALKALEYHFNNYYKNPLDLTVDDGILTVIRCTIDSRGFNPNYLICDNMKEPIELGNVDRSLLRLSRYYMIGL